MLDFFPKNVYDLLEVADDYLDAGLSLTVPWRPERDLARVIDDLRGS